MIGLVTQEARDAQNARVKAAHMAAGAPAVPGVPSGAEGRIGRGQENVTEPAAPVRPLIGPSREPDYIRAEDLRRSYLEVGHAAQSPANPPGLARQSARISDLAMTTVGRRP